MNQETTQMINRLAEIVGKSSEYVVNQYTIWYLAQSIGYVLFGITIIVLSSYFCKYPKEWDQDNKHWFTFLKWFLIGIGSLFIVCNIGDLFSPTAIGIHRLILDIRG